MLTNSSIQSKGGKARAEVLTKEERKEIASKAARVLWSTPKAAYEGELRISESHCIPCAVLTDATRVITHRGMQLVFGGRILVKKASLHTELSGFALPVNLTSFAPVELEQKLTPLKFRSIRRPNGAGGRVFVSYQAEALPMVCQILAEAKREGKLFESQLIAAKTAEKLLEGFSKRGVSAQIDEVTGYRKFRLQEALSQNIHQYFKKQLLAWTLSFPIEFFEEIFRLRNWKFDPNTLDCPLVIGTHVNNLVYARLSPKLLDTLQRTNPKLRIRKGNQTLHLHGEVPNSRLAAHLEGVRIVSRESNSWDEFLAKLNKHYPLYPNRRLNCDINSGSQAFRDSTALILTST